MSSLHDHNFKDLPTDWRHDGPLSARNDEKHLPTAVAIAQPTPGALRAAHAWLPAEYGRTTVLVHDLAIHIDREAVKPATAELLAALNDIEPALVNLHCALQGTACMDPKDQRIAVTTGGVVRDLQVLAVKVRAVLAKHEGRL